MASFLARRVLVIVALFGLLFPYLGCAPAPSSTQPTATPGFPSLALPSPTPGGAAPASTATPRTTTPGPLTPVPTATKTPSSAAKPSYGGTITSTVGGDPASYDAHRETSIFTLGMVAPTYDRLIETEAITSKLLPGLAEKWEVSSDGKTVTFSLRKGVKWHDGKPFTSADAKATLDKIISPPQGVVSPRKALVGDGVGKVEAPDDFTLKVTLERPRGGFIPAVASAWNVVVPKHIIDAKGDVTKDVIGTGPFKFKEHLRGVSWELAKNPDYWVAGKPYLDGIITYIVPDAANRLAALRTKHVNLWYNFPSPTPTDVAILTRQFGDQIWVQQSGYWGFGGLTFNLKRYPWSDIRVRTAADLAVDRDEALKIAFKSGGGAHHGIMSPEGPWGTPVTELLKRPGWRHPKDADMAEAKRLIAEMDVPRGFKVSIMTRQGPPYDDHAVYTKSVLDSLGFDASIRALETGASLQSLTTGDFDVAAYHYAYPIDDPDSVFGDFYTTNGARVAPGYSNKTLDDLFVKQTGTVDFAARKKIVDEMTEIAFNDHSRAIFGVIQWNTVGWKEVQGWQQWAGFYNNLNMADVWIAK